MCLALQDWHNQTAVARAFQIGKNEAGAVSQLLTNVHLSVKDKLLSSVKQRGMTRFVSHECIARQIFSNGFSSGMQSTEAWKDILTNVPGSAAIVACLIHQRY